MKKKILAIVMIFSMLGCSLYSQNSGCSAPEQSQFNFWIGTWNCVNENNTIDGKDIITRQLDSCIVQENFSDLQNKHKGWSWTVFDQSNKVWQQTFVSNNGQYFLLTGGMKGDSMILTTQVRTKSGTLADYRILYCNIKSDHFDWSWDLSLDGGKTWTPKWKLRYERTSG